MPPVSAQTTHAVVASRFGEVLPEVSRPQVTVVLASRGDLAPGERDVASWIEQCEQTGSQMVLPRGDALRAGTIPPLKEQWSSRAARVELAEQGRRAAGWGDVVVLASRPPRDGELSSLRARISRRTDAPRVAGLLSVVVPVHEGAAVLAETLGALRCSDLPAHRWELVVVDDASTDGSAEVAAAHADVIVRLRGDAPYGPAYARNRGFEVAAGECVAFVDADVRVRPDALRLFVGALEADPSVAAVVGSYDDCPPAGGLVSQHRNLLHHFYHQRGAGRVVAFWGGCGAVRSESFARAGMYDEWHFTRPQVEDIELGIRLRDAGFCTVLRPDIQGTHLKRWTLAEIVATDLRDRGASWMRVVNQRLAADPRALLTLRAAERRNTLLACLAALALALPVALPGVWGWAAPAACLAAFTVGNRDQYAFFGRLRGALFAAATVPLDLLYYLVNGIGMLGGWALRVTVGEPRPDPVAEAMAEVGAETWPPVRRRRSGARTAPHAVDRTP